MCWDRHIGVWPQAAVLFAVLTFPDLRDRGVIHSGGRRGGNERAKVLRPLWEKVSAQLTDEGSR